MDIAEAVAHVAALVAKDRAAHNLADSDNWSDWDTGRKFSEALERTTAYAVSDRLVVCRVPDVTGYGAWEYVAAEVLDVAAGCLFGGPYQVPETAEVIKLGERVYSLEW